MIEFKTLQASQREQYNAYFSDGVERGCEYAFANHIIWGRQQAAFTQGHLLLFSQFNRRSVYPYPVGQGDKRPVIDAIIADAAHRGIPCRITGITAGEKDELEALYPGKFRFHCDRDSYDYVYDIRDLAELKGRKYQKKRNHINRFRQNFPESYVQPLTQDILPAVEAFAGAWYARRLAEEPSADLHMEKAALKRAFRDFGELGLEGLALMDGERLLAFTLGSAVAGDTFDVHFEKASADADGAYPAINQEFARYLLEKYPRLRWLNREEDMGLEGLRKAKLSYYPHHLIEKCWACLLEDGYDY